MKVFGNLERASLEVLAVAPAVGVTGRIFYDSVSNQARIDNDTSYRYLGLVPTTVGRLPIAAAAGFTDTDDVFYTASRFNLFGSAVTDSNLNVTGDQTILRDSGSAGTEALLNLVSRTGDSIDGDSFVHYKTQTSDWSLGVDNADSNAFVLTATTFLGAASRVFRVDLGTQICAFDQVVHTVAGSAALPSYSFTGADDLGWYNSAANTLSAAVAGIQTFQIGVLGQLNIFGNANSPSITFLGDNDLGFFRVSSNVIGVTSGGFEKFQIGTLGQLNIFGTANSPSITFIGDNDLGFYRAGVNLLGVTAGGFEKFQVGVLGQLNIFGTANSPSITFIGDNDLGFYRAGANILGITTGGFERVTISNTVAIFSVPIEFPVFNDAGRPAPGGLNAGSTIFNSDDNFLNTSDGTNWRDPTGAVT